MNVLYLGHSAFCLTGDSGHVLLVDPFLTGNPKAVRTQDSFARVDWVFVTHDHDDHLGDSFPLCQRTGATFVGIYETAMKAASLGIPVEPMSIGGTIRPGPWTATMVNAQHGAGQGHAAGYVLQWEGRTIYFAGDTALFSDMKMYGELWTIDLAVLPIGDRFTMGPEHAAKAVEWLRPGHVVPCHYGTFPLIAVDPQKFQDSVGSLATVHVLAPGQSFELPLTPRGSAR